MAEAARERGYEYIGITDHSQRLKIASGVSIADLRTQIRFIDKLNGNLPGIRVLKSSEVDILADGSLDYPEEILKELDYTVCSIHSRFGLDRNAQTERLMRAMDNRFFNILGHATGRLLLKRPGYEIDIDRVIEQARPNGCFLEINSSPDRLDVSADTARRWEYHIENFLGFVHLAFSPGFSDTYERSSSNVGRQERHASPAARPLRLREIHNDSHFAL